jgi:hypothetical protein
MVVFDEKFHWKSLSEQVLISEQVNHDGKPVGLPSSATFLLEAQGSL